LITANELHGILQKETRAMPAELYQPHRIYKNYLGFSAAMYYNYFLKYLKYCFGIGDTKSRKLRLVVVNTFNAWPAHNGGQQRLLNIYRYLSERADITLISLVPPYVPFQLLEFNPSFREIKVRQTIKHYRSQEEIDKSIGNIAATDIAAIDGLSMTPAFERILRYKLQDADIAVAEHPYCFRTLQRVWSGPVLYHAYNVEAELKKTVLPSTGAGRRALDAVVAVERDCGAAADRIFVVSELDRASMAELYDLPVEKIIVVPNGTNLPAAPLPTREEREENKRRLNLSGNVAIYTGSSHPPNVEGGLALLDVARLTPDWLFIFVGTICDARPIKEGTKSANILLLGELSEIALEKLLAAADLGINPIVNGSGTNLKMLAYMSHGLEALTTPIGNRGFNFVPEEQCYVAELQDFPSKLGSVAGMNLAARDVIAKNGFEVVAANFQWRNIASKIPLPALAHERNEKDA
jgi:glycosyltransferase involved in cell wall biosynthesis